jgi:hypothetical protein
VSEQPQFGSPEWQRQVSDAMGKAGRALNAALEQPKRILAAQGAMGWAYRGDLDGTRTALKSMSPDQLQELSAAASMLTALADEELSTR